MIKPDNNWKTGWDIFLVFFIIARVFFVSYHMAYNVELLAKSEDDAWRLLYSALPISAILAFDIWLTFNTAYFHDEDGLVRDKKKIAHKYFGFWFIPDLFWCLPLRAIFSLM